MGYSGLIAVVASPARHLCRPKQKSSTRSFRAIQRAALDPFVRFKDHRSRAARALTKRCDSSSAPPPSDASITSCTCIHHEARLHSSRGACACLESRLRVNDARARARARVPEGVGGVARPRRVEAWRPAVVMGGGGVEVSPRRAAVAPHAEPVSFRTPMPSLLQGGTRMRTRVSSSADQDG